MNEIQIFKNEQFGEIRTLEVNGQPYFVGIDVAKALGYEVPKKALFDHVDDEDKIVLSKKIYHELLRFQNGTLENFPNRGLTIINESGIYSLIMSSKLPDAKKFKHWVTSEVLPEIRRTGSYNSNNLNDERILEKLEILEKKIDILEEKVDNIESYSYNLFREVIDAVIVPCFISLSNKIESTSVKSVRTFRKRIDTLMKKIK